MGFLSDSCSTEYQRLWTHLKKTEYKSVALAWIKLSSWNKFNLNEIDFRIVNSCVFHRCEEEDCDRAKVLRDNRVEEQWRVGQCFLSPIRPCSLPDFGHKANITINSSGTLTSRSEQCQVIVGCCMYSILWHCLYPTGGAGAAFGLNDVGFNSPRSDLSQTPDYLTVYMIICVNKNNNGTMLQSGCKR